MSQKTRPFTQKEIRKMVADLSAREFYGDVTLKFVAGKVVIIDKKETLKPEGATHG